jgi:hypothetical protein
MPLYGFPNVVILGYPKTGTTWIQLLFRIALTKSCKLNEKKFVKSIFEMCEIEATHNLPNFNLDTWPKQIVYFDLYRGKDILFITRDPRDTILSLYMDLIHRVKYLDSDYDINNFPKHPIWGINKFLKYHMIFEQNFKQGMFKQVALVRYEDMHRDTLQCFTETVEKLGMQKAIREGIAQYAVEFCSFENMKKMEIDNTLNWQTLSIRAKDIDSSNVQPENLKCRAGKIGEYRKYFSQEIIDFMNMKIEKEMPEMFGYSV